MQIEVLKVRIYKCTVGQKRAKGAVLKKINLNKQKL